MSTSGNQQLCTLETQVKNQTEASARRHYTTGGKLTRDVVVSVESRSECLRPVVYSSLTAYTSCIVKSVPSFRALSRRLKSTLRRHTFNNDSLSARAGVVQRVQPRDRHALNTRLLGCAPWPIATLSGTMYLLISFGKSSRAQNRQFDILIRNSEQ